ncbi:Protein diaphanous 2 [Liparis tanakae]|uniref:Protein diaphanous 2 n=1 Tax=Liparis tanakae TaxID=230148 RepID=A0A4Z2I1Y3_9TELE|nr:Protein diaphanous 2 [Liparis tanakae]
MSPTIELLTASQHCCEDQCASGGDTAGHMAGVLKDAGAAVCTISSCFPHQHSAASCHTSCLGSTAEWLPPADWLYEHGTLSCLQIFRNASVRDALPPNTGPSVHLQCSEETCGIMESARHQPTDATTHSGTTLSCRGRHQKGMRLFQIIKSTVFLFNLRYHGALGFLCLRRLPYKKSSRTPWASVATDSVYGDTNYPVEGQKVYLFFQVTTIFLGSFRLPYEEIRDIVLQVDEERLSESLIQNLIKNLPEQKELNALAELKGEYEELVESEQFGIVMSSVKLLRPRLNGILFKLTFEEQVNNIRPDIMNVTFACEEVKKSESLCKLLELVLLSSSTAPRRAKDMGLYWEPDRSHVFLKPNVSSGFTRTALRDTKSITQKTTLLHFLAEKCEESHQEILRFPDELEHVESASKVPAEILNSSLSTMERHIQRLENDIKNFPKTDDQHDKFVEKMMISFFYGIVIP